MIKGNIQGQKVLVKANDNYSIFKVKKEFENGEVLYTNNIIGRVEDIKIRVKDIKIYL